MQVFNGRLEVDDLPVEVAVPSSVPASACRLARSRGRWFQLPSYSSLFMTTGARPRTMKKMPKAVFGTWPPRPLHEPSCCWAWTR